MRAVELMVALGMIITMANAIWSDEAPVRTARVCVLEPVVDGPVTPDASLEFHPFCQ